MILSSLRSKITPHLVQGLLALVFILAAFWMGMAIGERRTRHFAGWYDSYRHSFASASHERFSLPSARLPNAHGVFGRVVSVSGQNMVIQGSDDIEQSVLVTTSTAIRLGNRDVELKDIRTDEQVSVFGMPNGLGQIEARLVRLLSPAR